MTDFDSVDFFTDESVFVNDPYPYFEHLRAQNPVQPTGHHGVVAVTGYAEAAAVYRDLESYSSCNAASGPFMTLPVPLEGDDIGPLLEQHRDHVPQNDLMVTMDQPMHTRERALLMRLMTPARLKENESFMWRLADEQLDLFIDAGHCEFISAYAQPFSMLVIADLLGVPHEHHSQFLEGFGLAHEDGGYGRVEGAGLNSLAWVYQYFVEYVEERRNHPRADVLTELAQAVYPDGSTPGVMAVVHVAAFLFAAGQETTARLLGAALKYLAEYPGLQDQLRSNRELIPNFIEECLRLESPVKTDFRLVKRSTKLAGVDLAAGTPLAIFSGAANRDARHFDEPNTLKLDRPNVREQIAFGRGIHTCPGGPLARAEARISLERILSRTRDIRFSQHHGPAAERLFEYEVNWNLRGLTELHLEFTPVAE